MLCPIDNGHSSGSFTLRAIRSYKIKGHTAFCSKTDVKSAGRRYTESDGEEAAPQGTNHGFFRSFLGFGATAVIMA